MCNIIYTKEQEDIFEYVKTGILNVLIEAVAGAGKTTTLIECVKRIIEFHGSDKRILLLAHNKSTRDTLQEKINKKLEKDGLDGSNIKVFTLHGLAWRLYREHYDEKPEINDDKYKMYISQNINEIGTESYLSLNNNDKMIYRGNLLELINIGRHYLKSGEKELRKLSKKLEIPLISDECHMVANILKWGKENRDIVDFQDLLWYPYELGYYSKLYTADYIFLDEAQDASIAQQEIITRCMKRNTRLIAFGDTDQTINSWCGSDINSLDNILENEGDRFRRKAKPMPLTTNYRCGKKIIEYAKRYSDKTNTLNEIKPHPDAVDGVVRFDVNLTEIQNNDMVLCRNTAPLMELYRRMVSNGQKVYFKGEELGKNLMSEVEITNGDTIHEVIFNLKQRMIAWWDFLTKENNLDPRETMVYPQITKCYDIIKTLEELPKTIKTKEDLRTFVKDIFKNEGQDGVQLSTIHKAKGLEADNIFIICPSLIPSRLAQTEDELAEERRLQYVMCTRPKYSLNFVTERDIKPNNAYSENNSFYDELINIKNEIINV